MSVTIEEVARRAPRPSPKIEIDSSGILGIENGLSRRVEKIFFIGVFPCTEPQPLPLYYLAFHFSEQVARATFRRKRTS